MNIVFAASECYPFFKTGGLADVIGSLPPQLQDEHAHVSVILPKASILQAEFEEQLTFVASFPVYVKWRKQYCGVFTLQQQSITYYFIDNEYYFKREQLYGYPDDGERFVFFTHAILALLEELHLKVDFLHCHDWQTALLPAYLKTKQADIQTVFTIHNLQYQGIFPESIFNELLHFSDEHLPGLLHEDCINFVKAAIFHADFITTVSPSYAEEITTELGGEGLHQILFQNKNKLCGILNGVDTNNYDPLLDPNISVPFYQDPDRKSENKLSLQDELHLPLSKDIAVLAVVSRLVQSKGPDLLLEIADELLQTENVQLIIVGTGEERLEQNFLQLQSRYPSKVRTVLGFSESFARKVYASADFLLMPSLFEPCGLSQMVALQYETVPIVRETGGLKDTITAFNEYEGAGNGLSFTNYNASDFLYTIRRGLYLYKNKELWNQLLSNVYKSSFNWEQSALMYKKLYLSLRDRRGVSTNEHHPNRVCPKLHR
ncbi:glycogen synthase [Alkalihalobacillus sp. 1P02AB]|uniref:glycogen synthase n=1 Tax=Alkalihalobacillus sp. 1P02AB TaxID=3132260 RepID=UPI0039A5DA55